MKDCVDAVNFTDNQLSIVRMSPLASSILAIQLGLEPVLQMTCRDRNRLALQSEVLGAHAFGIRNLFCLTGDPISLGNHPQGKAVYDLKVVEWIRGLKRMREAGVFFNGEPLKGPAPDFFLGCAANPFHGEIQNGLRHLQEKMEAGAEFIQTQPVFDLEQFQKWLEGFKSLGLHQRGHLLVGIMLVKSLKSLDYLYKVPGISIPPSLAERIRKNPDPLSEGIQICAEIMARLKTIPEVKGLHLMTIGAEEKVPEILRRFQALAPAPTALQGPKVPKKPRSKD